ncbi:MAG TPA: hypothetical protein VGH33_10300 [Isosphaeraceae bacterium]|jgi:hypothetical protein
MSADPARIARELVALRTGLGARAAGAWRVEGDRLVQLAFDAADDMPPDVASAFAAATVFAPLDRRDLGIVEAAVRGERRVSLAANLPADAGSGYWLRAFGAGRSIAVPIAAGDGTIVGVVSVALAGFDLADDAVEGRLREATSGWFASD